jgi:hypothetical protein
MKRITGITLGLITLTGFIALLPRGVSHAQPTQPAIAKLVTVNGKVLLKSYSQDPNWRTATPGTTLLYGDLLKVPPQATATIECLNNPSIKRIVPNDGIAWGVASACPLTRQTR